ncbi:O-acetyl-ADP-ribose deacetylase [Carboxylicivirga mesophila]|uniref:O-acetyl-ADP-ribose deacetylase n=1 Tax=Carboxylicivirga mesophila TaxID=1166478 RepID=A0ABS5KDJ4_9BACT|nr:O-acetyl-ADP-ribose deacetylase [Carboxylicivirga mesophila]MBS2212573.1 O-acetyl-ADP-ribose deacetylase [Carboxylicivirga mesophila]
MDIQLLRGDITRVEAEAIVNAANSGLLGGGGVDGAIHRAGGSAIMEECKIIRSKQGGCPTGQAVVTSAGNMPYRYVIHTVGPVWRGGADGEPELLKACYINSLKLTDELNIISLAFPNISTGVYGYPKHLAAEIAIDAVRSYQSNIIRQVVFVCFDEENYSLYQQLIS